MTIVSNSWKFWFNQFSIERVLSFFWVSSSQKNMLVVNVNVILFKLNEKKTIQTIMNYFFVWLRECD